MILFHYIHRDEGNWKDHLEVVLENPDNLTLDVIEARIKRLLVDGVFLSPTESDCLARTMLIQAIGTNLIASKSAILGQASL